MKYSQNRLIQIMKEGAMPGESTVPKHIETVISNVFIFDTKVYKFYKDYNDFFNTGFRDISGKKERFSFTRRDYEWNRALSPSIYSELIGVQVSNDSIQKCVADENADELVIVMNRVDTNHVLFEKIMRGELSEEESFSVGKQLASSLKKIQKKLDAPHNLYHIFESRIKDLVDWIRFVEEYVSEEESHAYAEFLDSFRKKNRELFEGRLSSEVTTDGDFHSHNAILSDGSFYLIDTFPPKEEWAIGHTLIPVYRIGSDILALSGRKELFEAFIKGYEDGSDTIVNRELDPFFIVYASGIMMSTLYNLQKTDPSKRDAARIYHAFLRKYFTEINKDVL